MHCAVWLDEINLFWFSNCLPIFTIYCSNILKYLFWLFLLQEINFIDLAFDLEIAFHPAATLLPFPAPYGIAWYGVVLFGVVWYCMLFLGMAWHGIVWYPVQPFYPSQHPWHAFHCRCSITILNHVQKIISFFGLKWPKINTKFQRNYNIECI